MTEIKFYGALTTERLPQLDINRLVRNGYIKQNKYGEGNYQASKGDPELFIISDLRSTDKFVKLKYNSLTGTDVIEKEIKVATVLSNLGKDCGVNLYFICPVTNKKAKILYFNYVDQSWVSRESYPQRIYYPLQVCSKDEGLFQRGYLIREKLLKKLLEFKNYGYGGNMTNAHKQIEKLVTKQKAIRLLLEEREERLFEKFQNRKLIN